MSSLTQSPQYSPCQPLNIRFPVSYFSGKARSFQSDWYRERDWLEYSVSKDAAFCFACRMFPYAIVGGNRPNTAFTREGFRDWRHGVAALNTHSNSESHEQSYIAWKQFRNSLVAGSVADQLGSCRAELVKKSRHYIRTVAEVLLLCSKQEIPFRSHDESSSSLNKGNFLEILNVIAKHGKVIEEKLLHGPRNAKYTSATIQNDIIGVMANQVRRTICNSIKMAGYYSLMADETKDMGKTEQMSIVVRFFDSDTCEVKERFLTFVEATSLNAENLTKYNIDPQLLVSQGYDEASVMSGHCAGVQQRVREVVSHAIYIHCHAHILNLVLVDCARKNSIASEFFSLLQSLYVFMSTSKAHVVFLAQQKELHPDKQTKELKRLSDTRWACCSLTLDVICSTYDSIIATLEILAEDPDKTKAVESIGLLNQIRTFKFLASLIILQRVMSIMKLLSDQLQSKTVDLAHAVRLVLSTTATLKDFRTDDVWNHTYKYICDVAKANNLQEGPVELHTQRRRRQPRALQDSVISETVGQRESLSSSQSIKVNIYFPVLDSILSELDCRFSGSNLDIMKSLDACNPRSSHFLDLSLLSSLASSYEIDSCLLSNEC